MSAAAEQRVQESLGVAVTYRARRESAQAYERVAVVRFIDNALLVRWSWKRIGEALDISDVAARRYYERNRRKVRNV